MGPGARKDAAARAPLGGACVEDAVLRASSGAASCEDAAAGHPLRILRPGRVPYAEGLALQERVVAQRRGGAITDTLILLEHDPVITLGRAADRRHVLLDAARLETRGITMFETGRGGDVTLHSPGQVVGYPILALAGDRRDAHRYLRDLEEVMIRAAADFGVSCGRIDGLTGVWAGRSKLGAIGVRIHSGWITSHGFAFNVSNDLGLFGVIVPCGIPGRGVTSLSRHLGRTVELGEAMDRLQARFLEVFRFELTSEPGRRPTDDPRSSARERSDREAGRGGLQGERTAKAGWEPEAPMNLTEKAAASREDPQGASPAGPRRDVLVDGRGLP